MTPSIKSRDPRPEFLTGRAERGTFRSRRWFLHLYTLSAHDPETLASVNGFGILMCDKVV